MVYTGTLCLHECPWNKNVADLLLIGGLIGILKCVLKVWLSINTISMNTNEEYTRLQKCVYIIQLILSALILVWFLLVAFRIYYDNELSTVNDSESLYNFGFWLIKSIFTICGVCLLILYCMRKLYCCCAKKSTDSTV